MQYPLLLLIIFALVVLGIAALIAWGVAKATKSSGGGVGSTGPAGAQGATGQGVNTVTGWLSQTFAEQYLLISDAFVPQVKHETGFQNPMGITVDLEASMQSGVDVFWVAANCLDVNLNQDINTTMRQYSYTYSATGGGSVNLLQTLTPTGLAAFTNSVVFPSTSTAFVFGIPGGATGPSRLIAAGQRGRIYAYNPSVASFLFPVIDHDSVASYMGLETLNDVLYASNFKTGNIEMYNTFFALINTFTDPNAGFVFDDRFHPFSIHFQNGLLFATFVQNNGDIQPINNNGNGVLDIFLPDGTFVSRFQGNSYFNSPFGFQVIPSLKSPSKTNEMWIANYGNGFIQRFDFTTAAPLPLVQSTNRDTSESPYCWDLYFPIISNSVPGRPLQVLTTSGVVGGTEGALRLLTPAPPDTSP